MIAVGALAVLVWPNAGITAPTLAVSAAGQRLCHQGARLRRPAPGSSSGAPMVGSQHLELRAPHLAASKASPPLWCPRRVPDFVTAPGNSSNPPAGLGLNPTITVLVTDSVSKSGPVIFGDVIADAEVLTDPGYAPDPGHAGTGKAVI